MVSPALSIASASPQRRTTPISGPAALFSLAAEAAAVVTSLPRDAVLAGMVAAGQGIRAICLYLGLSRAALDDHLVRLGLERPHDRPLRKPGSRSWSELDTQRLIVWRLCGIHPETIGPRLGRSPNAVRAKARRLGIPRPDRKSLQRLDPASLEDSAPLFADRTDAGSLEASPKSPPAVCDTAAGPVGVRGGADASGAILLRLAVPESDAEAAAPPRPGKRVRSHVGEPQLPLSPVVPCKDRLPEGNEASAPQVIPLSPQLWPLVVELERRLQQRIKAELNFGDVVRKLADIRWVGETPGVLRDARAALALSLRYFGGQHWKWIAQDAGMHEPQLASQLTRLRLPRDFDRWKFRKTYNLECALYTLLDSGFVLRRPTERSNYQWVSASDLRNVHQSWETRRKLGLDDEGQGRRRETPRTTLVTPRELAARRPRPSAPISGGWPKAEMPAPFAGYLPAMPRPTNEPRLQG